MNEWLGWQRRQRQCLVVDFHDGRMTVRWWDARVFASDGGSVTQRIVSYTSRAPLGRRLWPHHQAARVQTVGHP